MNFGKFTYLLIQALELRSISTYIKDLTTEKYLLIDYFTRIPCGLVLDFSLPEHWISVSSTQFFFQFINLYSAQAYSSLTKTHLITTQTKHRRPVWRESTTVMPITKILQFQLFSDYLNITKLTFPWWKVC